MTTANDVFLQAMAIADEMTDTINVVNASDTASYKARTPGIITLLQAELGKQGDLFDTFEWANKPIEPLGGMGSGFDYVSYTGTEITKEYPSKVYAYTFEADGEGTVYIEDYTSGWNTLATVAMTDPTTRKMVRYSGVVTPTTGATKSRFRFVGSYEYTFTNYALFGVPMKAARIPDYSPWIKVAMPSNFKSVEQIISEYPVQQYENAVGFKWENARDLYVDYAYEGTVRVNYRPIPVPITAMTDAIVLDENIARTLLPYGLAAELFKEENTAVANFCRERYAELKATASIKKPAHAQLITDVYGGY